MNLVVKHFTELSARELHAIYKARMAVFIVEQNCAYQDIDDFDTDAYHLYLEEDGSLLAYVRVLPAGTKHEEVSIGRVISLRRHEGLASALIAEGIKMAREKYNATEIAIGAQVYAKPLYEKAGFAQCSEPYMEDGIPHIKMLLRSE